MDQIIYELQKADAHFVNQFVRVREEKQRDN